MWCSEERIGGMLALSTTKLSTATYLVCMFVSFLFTLWHALFSMTLVLLVVVKMNKHNHICIITFAWEKWLYCSLKIKILAILKKMLLFYFVSGLPGRPRARCRTLRPAASTRSHRTAAWRGTRRRRRTGRGRAAPSASQPQTCLLIAPAAQTTTGSQ